MVAVAPPTHPTGNWLLGHLGAFRRDTLAFLTELTRKGDPIIRIRLGPRNVYYINDPDLLHEIYVGNAESYVKDARVTNALRKTLGDGLLTSEGDYWRRQRRLAQPAFHHKRIAAYAQVAQQYAKEQADSWHDGQLINLKLSMAEVTLRIVARTLFDTDASEAATQQVTQSIGVLQEIATRSIQALITAPDWVPTPDHRVQRAKSLELRQELLKLIRQRRAENTDRGDLMSVLLTTTDADTGEKMTDDQVCDEVITLYLAGYDTSSLTLSWAFVLLAKHPAVEAALHAEVDQLLGGRPATWDDLPKLVYTNQVIKEVLRLYPAAWFATRCPVQEVKLGGYPIPKGTTLLISSYAMHRHPQYWPDAETFQPERFADNAERRLPKFVYFPFGGGGHICIGQPLALMEMPLILATLANRYRLRLADPAQPVLPDPQITIGMKGGVNMIVHVR